MQYGIGVFVKIDFSVYSHFLSPLEPHWETDQQSDIQKYITHSPNTETHTHEIPTAAKTVDSGTPRGFSTYTEEAKNNYT